MAILITGVEGFLGHRMAQLLNSSGEKVVGIDVMEPASQRFWPVLKGDVTDRTFLDKLFSDHEIASIIHCGGISGPHVCNRDPARVFEVNVQGTLNLFESARKKHLHGRILFVSSSSVYGQAVEKASCEIPVVEDLALLASEPYGCSKVACESMMRSYARQEGVDIIALRVSIVYGPGRTTYCGITEMLKSALKKEPVILRTGCDLPLPWVHIDDVCSAFHLALQVPKDRFLGNETLSYNLTGPGYPTFREIAKIVQKICPGTVVEERGEPDPYAMNARKMSLEAIGRDFFWKPRVKIEEGIRSLYETIKGTSLQSTMK